MKKPPRSPKAADSGSLEERVAVLETEVAELRTFLSKFAPLVGELAEMVTGMPIPGLRRKGRPKAPR